MAKKPNKKIKKKKRSIRFSSLVFALITTVGAVLMMPTTIIFVIGMIPSVVAAFVDQTKEKTAGITIGAMNFAGVLPSLLELWQRGHAVENALSILAQPLMLLYMYGGAGIGALIYVNTPALVSGYLRRKGYRRLEKIEKRHKELVKKWGVKVMGTQGETSVEKA